jgi:CRP/FNR family transcriptional regulator
MKNTADLAPIPLFSRLSADELAEIASSVEQFDFRKRETIFSEGDRSNWLYILQAGKVKITKVSHDGKEIIVEMISPGDFFGAFAVLKGFPYPANAVAMENSSVVRIGRHQLLGMIERFPNLIFDITANLGERVREFHDTLKTIALERVESRIAALLLKLAEKTGTAKTAQTIEIPMRLTKQDIAEMVGTTVETSIRVMSKFRKAGYIRENDGRIFITDRTALQSVLTP